MTRPIYGAAATSWAYTSAGRKANSVGTTPAAQRYLPTDDEIAEALDAERDARVAAEDERDAERERVRELEAELKRLRGS